MLYRCALALLAARVPVRSAPELQQTTGSTKRRFCCTDLSNAPVCAFAVLPTKLTLRKTTFASTPGQSENYISLCVLCILQNVQSCQKSNGKPTAEMVGPSLQQTPSKSRERHCGRLHRGFQNITPSSRRGFFEWQEAPCAGYLKLSAEGWLKSNA